MPEPIRDQYHDPAYSMLYHLLEGRPEVTEFVKHAELDDGKVAELPDSAFAWPERRLFPIDTPENTVLSSLYREKIAAVPAEVDQALKRAQDVYEVNAILERARQQEKVAAEQAAAADKPIFLLPRLGRLRVKTAADVKVAEEKLLEQYPRLAVEDRAEGFINLVKAAQVLGVLLQPKTHQMAGMTVCTTKTAMDLIESRRMATKDPLFQRAYEKLATAFAGRDTITDRDELIKVADALTKLDRQAGIDHRYDKTLPDPIQTVFNTTKVAEEMVDVAGRQIALSKLAAMPATFWQDLVGPDMVKEITDKTGSVDITKLTQVLPTLPLDLKLVLKNQMP
jgi:hypothetical protein